MADRLDGCATPDTDAGEMTRLVHAGRNFIAMPDQAANYDRGDGRIHSTKAETGQILGEL